MKISRITLSIALLSIISLSAGAQNNRTLADENIRINHGLANGELTVREAAGLKMQEAHLRREAIRFKMNDGKIGPMERAKLARDNRRLSRNIYRQKHDCQRRF